MNPLLELQSNSGPVVKGPIDRARQLNDAEAPLTVARLAAEGTVFVTLAHSISGPRTLYIIIPEKTGCFIY